MRRLARFTLPLLLLAPLAGCGEASASPQQVIAAAPQATVAESTATTTFEMAMQGIPGAGDVTVQGTGAVDFAHRRSSMTVDMGGLLAEAGLGDRDATMEAITDGTVAYLRSSLFDALLGDADGSTWYKLDVGDVSRRSGLDLAQLAQPGSNDPAQQLAMLAGVSEDGVKVVGHEDVNGVRTTRYAATIDLRKAMRKAGGVTDEDAFATFADQLGAGTVEVSVWIDGDGRVRRERIPMPLGKQLGGAKATMTMEFDHFGDPVDIQVPAGDVHDLQDLLDEVAGLGD